MVRLPRFLRTFLIIGATVLATEWVHWQFGTRSGIHLRVDSLSDVAGGDTSVTEAEFELYVTALETMHENHGLSVEDAAESEGMTLDTFRDIERRVQANDLLVERTRESLKRKAEIVGPSRLATIVSASRDEEERDPEL
jgi:hypothetical protein